MSPIFSTKPGDDPVKKAYDSLQRLLGCEGIKQKGRKPSPVTVIQKIFACLGQNLGSTTPHSKLQSLLSSVRTQFIPYLKSINGSGSSPKSASRKSINSSAKDVLFEEFHSWLDKLVYGTDTDLTASAHHKNIMNNSFSWTQIAEEAFEFLLEAVDESLFDKSQVGSKFIPLLIDLLCDKKVSTVVKRNAIGVVIMLISKPNNKENRDTILNDPHMLPRLLSILFDCRDVDLQFLTLEILFRLTPKEGHARDTLISKLSAYFANRPHPPSLKEKCSPNKQRLRLQDAFTEYLRETNSHTFIEDTRKFLNELNSSNLCLSSNDFPGSLALSSAIYTVRFNLGSSLHKSFQFFPQCESMKETWADLNIDGIGINAVVGEPEFPNVAQEYDPIFIQWDQISSFCIQDIEEDSFCLQFTLKAALKIPSIADNFSGSSENSLILYVLSNDRDSSHSDKSLSEWVRKVLIGRGVRDDSQPASKGPLSPVTRSSILDEVILSSEDNIPGTYLPSQERVLGVCVGNSATKSDYSRTKDTMAVKCHRLEKVGAEKVETEVNNDESATAAFPQRDKQSKERNAHPISRLNTIMPSPPNPSIVYQTESALKRKYAVNKPIEDVAAQRREKASKGIAQDVTFGRSESFAVCPDNKSIIAPPDDVNLHENGATRQRYSRSDQSQKSNDQRIHRTGDNSLICQSDNEVRRKPKKSDSSQSVDNPFRQSTEATHDVFLEKLKGCDSDSQDSLQESIATDYSEDIVDKSNDRNPKQRGKGGHKESYSLSSDIGTSESDHSVRDQEYDYPESQSSPSQCIVSESEDEDDEYVPSQNEKQRSKRHSRNSQRSRNGISSAKTSEKASNKKTNKEYMNHENHEESTEKGISSRNPKSKFNNNSPKSREQPKNGIVSFGQLLAHLSNSAKKKAIRETTETNDAEVSESENMRSLKRYYDQTDPADGEIYSERNAKKSKGRTPRHEHSDNVRYNSKVPVTSKTGISRDMARRIMEIDYPHPLEATDLLDFVDDAIDEIEGTDVGSQMHSASSFSGTFDPDGTDYPIDLSSLFSSNDHHNYSSGVKSDDFIPSSQYDYDFPFNSNNEIDTVRGKGYGHVAEMEIGKHSLEDIAADIDYMNLTKNGSLFTSLNEIDQEIVKSFTMIGKHYVAKLQMRQVDVQKVQQTAIRKLYEDRKLYKKRMGERRTKLFKNHLLRMQSLSDQTVNSVKEHQEAASDALNKANQCILAMLRPTSASPGKRRMKESRNSSRQSISFSDGQHSSSSRHHDKTASLSPAALPPNLLAMLQQMVPGSAKKYKANLDR